MSKAKTDTIYIRVNPSEKDEWKDVAMQQNLSLSEFVRNKVNEGLYENKDYSNLNKDFIKDLIELVHKLRKILSSTFKFEFQELERVLNSMEPEYSWDL